RDAELSGLPDHALLSIIRIPEAAKISPGWLMLRRVGDALILTLTVTLIVYFDRGGYSEELTFSDALYYSTVSLTTVGYGDITPVTQEARLLNVLVITPFRIAFLVLLVGTTLSVL